MRNAILPNHERIKLNKKMMFQTKHADLLSQPRQRNQREKFETINPNETFIFDGRPTDTFMTAGKGQLSSKNEAKSRFSDRASISTAQDIKLLLMKNNAISQPRFSSVKGRDGKEELRADSKLAAI